MKEKEKERKKERPCLQFICTFFTPKMRPFQSKIPISEMALKQQHRAAEMVTNDRKIG